MTKKNIVLISLLMLLVVEIVIGVWQITPDMSGIGKAPHKLTEIAGITIPMGGINMVTIQVTWGIMLLLVGLSFVTTRRLHEIPGRMQSLFELIIEAFDKICRDTLGDKGRIFMPYVTTLFMFILISNWMGILPPIPHVEIEEPTRDLNTTLGLGIIAFFVSHIAAIRYKGIGKYITEYFEPMIEIKGFKVWNVVFMPLNVIGELGKLVSHSFRLYGNILGGAIIMQVISNLIRYIALPIGLNFFFGLFVGAVQAFVFSMLALTYIAVLVEE